jgi:hypothetical protein
MVCRFPHLSAFSKKFLEVCGAGLASAVVALLLGQTDKPAPPATPLSPVVYLSPADVQMIKLMHNEQAALLERLRSQPETPATPVAAVDATAAPPAAAPAPPPKSAPAASSRREPKSDRAPAPATAKRKADEPLPVVLVPGKLLQIDVASRPVAPPEADEPRNLPVPAVVAEAADWVSALRHIPGWFWPAGGGLLSEAPRPPMPVRNFLPRMM